jgi:micrococcal nuclease
VATMRCFILWLALTASASFATAQQSGASCLVKRISDGDTFRCADGRRVRLIGIDSPETEQHPYGEAARQALLQRVPLHTVVRLETDVAPLDRYGRVLAYVWVGPSLINETMVHDGWALLYTVPPDVRYVERLAQAQKWARANGAGLWSQGGFACAPSRFRRDRCVNQP